MKMLVMNEGRCGVNIINKDGWVTVVLTEVASGLLKKKYELFATKIYKEQLKGKVDPLQVVWLGHVPDEGVFEVLMQWHGDKSIYGQPYWHKRTSSSADNENKISFNRKTADN